jgi:hypothetical protein
MHSSIRFALSALLLTICSAAQSIHLPRRYNVVKAENGLVIGWNVESEDPQAEQVGIYDTDGKPVVELHPLRLVPGAKRASIHDVSARPGTLIAVAAVYRKDNATVPAATLLCFDFQGNPLTALALAPSREAWRVTLDSVANIWTLTTSAGGLSPSEAPMVVAYTKSGSVLREVLRRSEFSIHASEIQENSTVGSPAFGYTSRAVWLWLPGSTDLVTINGADGSVQRRSTTGLPNQSKHEIPERVVLTDAGTLLAQVWIDQEAPQLPRVSFFFRPGVTKLWSQFYPPCSNCTLIGADSVNAFFVKKGETGSDIYNAPLPQ